MSRVVPSVTANYTVYILPAVHLMPAFGVLRQLGRHRVIVDKPPPPASHIPPALPAVVPVPPSQTQRVVRLAVRVAVDSLARNTVSLSSY